MLPLFIKLCLLFVIRHVACNFCRELRGKVCCCCCCWVGCFRRVGCNLKYDRALSARETPRLHTHFLLAQGRSETRTAGVLPLVEGPVPGPLSPFPQPVGVRPRAGGRSHRRPPEAGAPGSAGGRSVPLRGAPRRLPAGGRWWPRQRPGGAQRLRAAPPAGRPGRCCP